MAGTTEGGRKAAITTKVRHGEDFYTKIGKKGGKLSTGGGFVKYPGLAAKAGAKGGRATRKKKAE